MAKNDFISDNLVHMRERLKENAARAGAPAAVPREDKTGTESAPPPPLSTRIPMRQAPDRTDGFDRQRRDFGCRLERDRAAVAAELELESRKIAELERFSQALDSLEQGFRNLASGETPEVLREFEKLRFAYYRASGRVSAFLKGGGDSASAPEREGIRHGTTAVWMPVAAAMVVSALIVAVTLIVLFH